MKNARQTAQRIPRYSTQTLLRTFIFFIYTTQLKNQQTKKHTYKYQNIITQTEPTVQCEQVRLQYKNHLFKINFLLTLIEIKAKTPYYYSK